MITYRFTANTEGMRMEADSGVLQHDTCVGAITTACYIPYQDSEATVYFRHPYSCTVIGDSAIGTVRVVYNHSIQPITVFHDGGTLVLQIEKQPAIEFEIANVKRN